MRILHYYFGLGKIDSRSGIDRQDMKSKPTYQAVAYKCGRNIQEENPLTEGLTLAQLEIFPFVAPIINELIEET